MDHYLEVCGRCGLAEPVFFLKIVLLKAFASDTHELNFAQIV